MLKHLQTTSISFTLTILLTTSCGISHNKIHYGSKKEQSKQRLHVSTKLNEFPDEDLVSDCESGEVSTISELKPLYIKSIKKNHAIDAPIIQKVQLEDQASTMNMSMNEDKTHSSYLNISEELKLGGSVVKNDEKAPSPERTKRNGKRSLFVSLSVMGLTFIILIFGVAGVIGSPMLGILLILFGLLTLVFLILGLTLLIIAGNRRRKLNKGNS